MSGYDQNNAARARAWRATHADRARDLVRRWQPRGLHDRGGPALTPLDVRAIRHGLDTGVPRKHLAIRYHVSYNTICRIDRGVTYNGPEYFD